MVEIYKNRSAVRWIILGVAVLISTGSILYTNFIVAKLKEREQKYIDLYAKTIEYASNENNRGNLTFINQEIIVSNQTIPVILTDANEQPTNWRNLDLNPDWSEERKMREVRKELEIMKDENEPIVIYFRNDRGEIDDFQFVFYKNSFLLRQLRYYPYVQLSVILVFGLLAFLAFSYSKTAEQNRVWVGLAKETAHQLGTPLSSLMAWLEYFRTDEHMKDSDILDELDKDIKRLETITARFSSIGSVPVLKLESIHEVISNNVNYLQKRISSKVKIEVTAMPIDIKAPINKPLFDWVIENICKNAVDAMEGSGQINITIRRGKYGDILIDIKDTGKGIPKNKVKDVFMPGFTTKQRGWGLGLTLVKRIVEIYHKGRIYVKETDVNVGTTFRIVLKP